MHMIFYVKYCNFIEQVKMVVDPAELMCHGLNMPDPHQVHLYWAVSFRFKMVRSRPMGLSYAVGPSYMHKPNFTEFTMLCRIGSGLDVLFQKKNVLFSCRARPA